MRIYWFAIQAVMMAVILAVPGDGLRPIAAYAAAPSPLVLKAEDFRHYVEAFNRKDNELYVQQIPNARAWKFLKSNIPLLDCPDKNLEEIYYFRWWTYRKHLRKTPDGFVVTEFLPDVPWAGKHNTINCAAGHHFMEGRWLGDPRYLDDYAQFWFHKGGRMHGPGAYVSWPAWAIRQRALVTGDQQLPCDLLDAWVRNYREWEKGWPYNGTDDRGKKTLIWEIGRRDNGLFSIFDGYEGCEMSIGGHGYRPLINSAMYGEATAIAATAAVARRDALATEFAAKAAKLKDLVQMRLWDPQKAFFMTLKDDCKTLSDCRELNGYAPWYFNLPDADKAVAWKQLTDPRGFYAPFGPTYAERRHPGFTITYEGHECQWNGPSWPYATSIVLTALGNLLNGTPQKFVGKDDYWKTFQCYLRSHRFREIPPGTAGEQTDQPWIDENLNPLNGDWIARTVMRKWPEGKPAIEERGKDYNHSTFCDLVISGLIGLRPRVDDVVEVNPLVPEGTWDYFCLDQVRYHGHGLTILYDKTGQRYRRGRGLIVFCDGHKIASADALTQITGNLPRH